MDFDGYRNFMRVPDGVRCYRDVSSLPSIRPPMPFTTIDSVSPRQLFGGAIRGRYTHLDGMTLGLVELDAETDVPMHQHMHEQITYVIEGQFDFTIGDESVRLEPGSVALIPSNAMHGGRTVTRCVVVDVFEPARDDYR